MFLQWRMQLPLTIQVSLQRQSRREHQNDLDYLSYTYLEYRLSILIRDPFKLRLRHEPAAPDLFHKLQTLCIVTKRPIHAIQDVIERRLTHEAGERCEGEDAARRDPNVGVPNSAQVALAGRPAPVRHSDFDDPVELEGEHLAHVPDDELDVWERVKEAAVEEAQDVEADFLV